MSERFVRAWVVDEVDLDRLRANGNVGASDVLGSAANAKCLEDVTVSFGKHSPGVIVSELLAGPLDAARVTHYRRAMELLLNHVAQPLAVTYVDDWREPTDQILLQWTYMVPNDSHGRWNPLLEGLHLPALAAAWAKPNVAFPWPRDAAPAQGDWPWPIWTALDQPTLHAVQAELTGLTPAVFDQLPAALLVEDEADRDAAAAELAAGLQRLLAWVTAALSAAEPKALWLLMDGDQ